MTEPISVARRCLVTIGAVSVCAAAVVLTVPAIEDWLRWPWDGELLPVAFFTVVVTIASLLGPFVAFDDAERTGSDGRAPESPPPTPTPGSEIDRLLDRRWLVLRPSTRHRRVRSRFREAAIRTIVRTTDCSTAAARERLERGTWTDDPVAAAFVRVEDGSASSRFRSLVDYVSVPRRARRTARAIRVLAAEAEAEEERR